MPLLQQLGKLPLIALDRLPGPDLTKRLADRCEACPVCRWSRANPDHAVAKVVRLHGALCPCWQSWERHYVESSAT